MLKQLYTKAAGFSAVNFNGSRAYAPFRIGLGNKEIIELVSMRIAVSLGVADVSTDIIWALLQKSETFSTGVAAPPSVNPMQRLQDNDILARGLWSVFDAANLPQKSSTEYVQEVVFHRPMYIPRSPTLEFFTPLNALVDVAADLYYYKYPVSDEKLQGLLKQFIGRKQVAVHNIQPVQEA